MVITEGKTTLIPVRNAKRQTKRFVKRKTTLRPFTFQRNTTANAEKSLVNFLSTGNLSSETVNRADDQGKDFQDNSLTVGKNISSRPAFGATPVKDAIPSGKVNANAKQNDIPVNLSPNEKEIIIGLLSDKTAVKENILPAEALTNISTPKNSFFKISNVIVQRGSVSSKVVSKENNATPADPYDFSNCSDDNIFISPYRHSQNNHVSHVSKRLSEIISLKDNGIVNLEKSEILPLPREGISKNTGRNASCEPNELSEVGCDVSSASGQNSLVLNPVSGNDSVVLKGNILPVALSNPFKKIIGVGPVTSTPKQIRPATVKSPGAGHASPVLLRIQNEKSIQDAGNQRDSLPSDEHQMPLHLSKNKNHHLTVGQNEASRDQQPALSQKVLVKRKLVNPSQQRKRPKLPEDVNFQWKEAAEKSTTLTELDVFLEFFNDIIKESSDQVTTNFEKETLRKFSSAVEKEFQQKRKLLHKYDGLIKQQRKMLNIINHLSDEVNSATCKRLRMENANVVQTAVKNDLDSIAEKINSLQHVQ